MTKANHEWLITQFKQTFPNTKNPQAVWAPGRVNLLGEHTDYNDGFVFPMAIDVGISIVGALNGSEQVNLYSFDLATPNSFSLKKIVPSESEEWTNYIRGVFEQFQIRNFKPRGMDLIIQGDVPQEAGLSSSAALEVAAAVLINKLHGWQMDAVELIKLAQAAENDFVGVASGIMDQFASMMGEANHAICLDCRTLEYESTPLPFEKEGYAVAVVNSMVKRGLVDSEYNARRQQCEDAVELLSRKLPGIKSLRDVAIKDLQLLDDLPPKLAKRARHVVTENDRVWRGVEALRAGDLHTFGNLLTESHFSLKDDFEVSCKELDLLVELALEIPGVLGSRMTGAGFGGCTIALVPQANLPLFETEITQRYLDATGLNAEIFIFKPASGALVMAEAKFPQT